MLKFYLQALIQSAQRIYEKREGSGARSGSGSLPMTNGSGSPTLLWTFPDSKIGGGLCFQTLYAGDWNNEKSVPGIEDLEPLLQVFFYYFMVIVCIYECWMYLWRDLIPFVSQVMNRVYWMIYRGPGFLAVVWFGSSPTPPPIPHPHEQVVSLSPSSCVLPVELTLGRGGGAGREPNHTTARKPGPL